MAVSVPEGLFMCFNPSCDRSGNLVEMVMWLKKCNYLEAARFINDADSGDSLKVTLREKKRKESISVPPEKVEEWHSALLDNDEALSYLAGRGIEREAIEHFKLGYSKPNNMIVTPMFDEHGECIGGVGRGIDKKVFKNIPGTKTAQSLFNIHNAKKHSTVIICESNFDAVRIHQAGYPGVVATLGGNFSEDHLQQMAYYFEKVIIMTDVDGKKVEANCHKCERAGNKYCIGHDPGRELGAKIAEKCSRAGLTVKWAFSGEYGTIYPQGTKDAGDMTDKQIRNCIENCVTTFEYYTL